MENKKEKYLYKFEVKDNSNNLRKFAILKPSRKDKEAGELYYASRLSNLIGSGVLPKIVWDKVFKDSGGIISDSDKRAYSDCYVKMAELKSSLDTLKAKDAKSEDQESEIEMIELELLRLRREMQELEMVQINAFENTAEAKARNKTIVWWSATLGAEEKNGKFEDVLTGGDIEEKLDFYDDEIEQNSFLAEVFSRINYLVTIWYLGSASTEEEFLAFDKEYIQRNKIEKEIEQIEDKNEAVEENQGSDVKAVIEEKSPNTKTDKGAAEAEQK
jgi:hypothetical protein